MPENEEALKALQNAGYSIHGIKSLSDEPFITFNDKLIDSLDSCTRERLIEAMIKFLKKKLKDEDSG